MYYKERTEFGTLSFSSDSTVGDDLLDKLCRSAEIDRREPVRPAASHWGNQHCSRISQRSLVNHTPSFPSGFPGEREPKRDTGPPIIVEVDENSHICRAGIFR